ncbi:MAG: hypothetical protein ACRES8_09045 [Nevskiaceae bacterium]
MVTAISACAGRVPETPVATTDSVQLAYRQAIALMERKDYEGAERALDSILKHPEFGGLSFHEQRYTVHAAGWVRYQRGDFAGALPLLQKLTDTPGADRHTWIMRMCAAAYTGVAQDAIRSLIVVLERFPESNKDLPGPLIHNVIWMSGRPPVTPAERFDLHEALFKANWKSELGIEPDFAWVELAAMWLERGSPERAREILKRVTHAGRLAVKVDSRFDAVVKDMPEATDVKRGLRNGLESARALVAARPKALEPLVVLSYEMLNLKQFKEVLALTEPYAGKQAAPSASAPQFEDGRHHIKWIKSNRAIALAAVGRYDEAVSLLRGASNSVEGRANISQSIQLGVLLCALARPREALAAVAEIDNPSPYGGMNAEWVRLMAALELEDREGVERSLAYMREHRIDAPGTYQVALVQAGRLDEAAAVLKERLADPLQRVSALFDVQSFGWPPPPSPQLRAWRRASDEFLRRPDVVSAIKKVGRVERFDYVFDAEWDCCRSPSQAR